MKAGRVAEAVSIGVLLITPVFVRVNTETVTVRDFVIEIVSENWITYSTKIGTVCTAELKVNGIGCPTGPLSAGETRVGRFSGVAVPRAVALGDSKKHV